MGDLVKIIIATGVEKLPKVHKSPNLVTLHRTRDSLNSRIRKSASLSLFVRFAEFLLILR